MQGSFVTELLAAAGELPRGPHGLSREEVTASQRRRMLRAALSSLAEQGWATTVAEVVARAGVSRKTFYEHFTDKEDCLLAAYDLCNDALLRHVAEAGGSVAPDDPQGQLRASVRAYLAFLAESPVFARASLVEAAAAGPRMVEHCAEFRRRLAALIRAWHQSAGYPRVPEQTFTAVVGAMHELALQEVMAGRTERLPELESVIMDIHLALLAAGRHTEGLTRR